MLVLWRCRFSLVVVTAIWRHKPSSHLSVEGGAIVRVASKNRPGFYWAIDEGIEGYLMEQPEMFTLVSPGLWGAGSVSFQSISRPGRFLRHRDGKIWIEEGDVTDAQFQKECSWFTRMDHFFAGFISFESVTQPGWFVRHRSRRLELSEIVTNGDRNDGSFIMEDVSSGMQVTVQTEAQWKKYLGKTVEVESKAVPSHFWATASSSGQARLELASHVFRMVPGLWGEDTVSFESSSSPGMFLRARQEKMWVEAVERQQEAAARECSFNVWDDRFFPGYTSFESVNGQEEWIRQKDRELVVEKIVGYQDTNDASFMLSEATAPPPTTTSPPPPPTTTRRPRTRRTTTRRTTTTEKRTTRRPTTPIPVFESRRPSKLVSDQCPPLTQDRSGLG